MNELQRQAKVLQVQWRRSVIDDRLDDEEEIAREEYEQEEREVAMAAARVAKEAALAERAAAAAAEKAAFEAKVKLKRGSVETSKSFKKSAA